MLLTYCQNENWAGYDPYDALNSRIFAATPFSWNRICRIVFTQAMKRLPINLRPLLGIPKTQNAKAIALFLMAFVKLSRLGLLKDTRLVQQMIDKLAELRSPNTPYCCWGYSFPWQTRTILVPRGAPNLVCTTFVANALLDAYELTHASNCLRMAVNAADYIVNELYWDQDDGVAGFSYPLPSVQARVHNANFLGAALLCRIYRQTGSEKFLQPALKVARYSAAKQRTDGSWHYGEHPTQHWIDNFHTGYNLCALRTIGQYAETAEFEPHVREGLKFYMSHFFEANGAPRYFHDRTYPIDIHSAAQSIITLLAMQDLDQRSTALASSVADWTMENMWDDSGYFYYHILPHYKDMTSYMRWSQAWMLLALLTSLESSNQE